MYASFLTIATAVALTATSASAATMYVHDSDGILGKVDTGTGAVSLIGNMGVSLTDIAFDAAGRLFGVSTSSLYAVDALTAATTFIGNHGIGNANALVFERDGRLLTASGLDTNLYTLDLSSGTATNLGSTGFSSSGDLAFVGDDLYLAAQIDQLVKIDLTDLALSTAIGPFAKSSVFGIATDADGTLFGVAGQTIFAIDPTTGGSLSSVSFAGRGLGVSFGQAFLTEAGAPEVPPVPLPATGLLLAGAVAMLSRLRRRA